MKASRARSARQSPSPPGKTCRRRCARSAGADLRVVEPSFVSSSAARLAETSASAWRWVATRCRRPVVRSLPRRAAAGSARHPVGRGTGWPRPRRGGPARLRPARGTRERRWRTAAGLRGTSAPSSKCLASRMPLTRARRSTSWEPRTSPTLSAYVSVRSFHRDCLDLDRCRGWRLGRPCGRSRDRDRGEQHGHCER